MLFLFVLVICLLSEPTLFDDNCYSLKQDIFNIYKHSEKFINGSIRISCSKTLVLHVFSLLMYTQKTVYKIRLQHIIKVVCRELKKCLKQLAKNKYPWSEQSTNNDVCLHQYRVAIPIPPFRQYVRILCSTWN